MMYRLPFSGTYPSYPDVFIGPLSNGYYVSLTGSSGSQRFRMCHASDPDTTVDQTAIYPNTVRNRAGFNSAGDAYFVASYATGGPYTIYKFNDVSGALSTSVVASGIPSVTSNISTLFVPDDDSQVMLMTYGSAPNRKLESFDTSTGTLVWTADLNDGGGHTSRYVLGCPGPDRYISRCYTHNALELWNGATNTLLSSTPIYWNSDTDWLLAQYQVVPLTGNLMVMYGTFSSGVYETYPQTNWLGVLDASGDVLSWWLEPTTYQTDWGDGYPNWWGAFAAVHASTGVVAMFPQSRILWPTPANFTPLCVNVNTGEVVQAQYSVATDGGTAYWSQGSAWLGFTGDYLVKISNFSWNPPWGVWRLVDASPTTTGAPSPPCKQPVLWGPSEVFNPVGPT